MQTHHSRMRFLCWLGLASFVMPGIGNTTVPCIDARPASLTGPPVFTFYRSDGASIRRQTAILESFDTNTNTLSVNDVGELRALRLNEWTSLDIALQIFTSPSQLAPPEMTELLKLRNAKYSLASMKILERIITYGDCATTVPNGEVRFQGKLSFDEANNSLIVDGIFFKFERWSGGPINPGIKK
jgi:hypothetical protein